MTTFRIRNRISGQDLGCYEGQDTSSPSIEQLARNVAGVSSAQLCALDAMARDAGYLDYHRACRAIGRTVRDCAAELSIIEAPRCLGGARGDGEQGADCGEVATAERTIEGVTIGLCAAHAAELDSEDAS